MIAVFVKGELKVWAAELAKVAKLKKLSAQAKTAKLTAVARAKTSYRPVTQAEVSRILLLIGCHLIAIVHKGNCKQFKFVRFGRVGVSKLLAPFLASM